MSDSTRYFAITLGCYDVGIPAAVCEAQSLESLVLEGLQAKDQCITELWNPFGILNDADVAYERDLTSPIPACVWNMPRLSTLHLSGNRLTGSLPDFQEEAAALLSLQDVTLSFNELTGGCSALGVTINISCSLLK